MMLDRPVPQAQLAYDYFAFISYNHEDEKWAKWLQRKLENYRLPTTLGKEERDKLPKRIRPVFRYPTDMPPGLLMDTAHQKLDRSKKLILICSPRAAESKWVNEEVRHFIDAGRYEDIIPFIVEGEPGGEKECFPEALRAPQAGQLLGISIAEKGRHNAFLLVVSELLGIKLDRVKIEDGKRRRRRSFLAAAAGVLLVLAGYRTWDHFVPHEAYYADYVLRWGIPQGIGPLTKQEIANRSEHYTIITKERSLLTGERQVVKLIHANSAGTPIGHFGTVYPDRPMIAEFSYQDDGRIRTVDYKDNNDKTLLAQDYTTDLKAMNLQASSDDSRDRALVASTTSGSFGMLGLDATAPGAANKSDISRFAFQYDGNGFVSKTIYMRNSKDPALDADGIGGLAYTLDSDGRPLEVRYLGLGGEGFATTEQNIAGIRYAYDGVALIREQYINPQGEPVPNAYRFAAVEWKYDERGNEIKTSFLDAEGEPAARSKYGYASIEREYDERGNIIRESYCNARGEPTHSMDGYAWVEREYDARGNEIKAAYFDDEGKPTLWYYGFAVAKSEYDERGNQIKESYVDSEGKPVICYSGFASAEWKYDGHGNEVKMTYFDAEGKPVVSKDGYATIEWEYDEDGNRIRESFFGAEGHPVVCDEGYAAIEWKYDERGNVIRKSLFATQGLPIPCEDGYARTEWKYDERGNLIKISEYFDGEEQSVLFKKGYVSMEWGYDEHGNLVRRAYFDGKGQPVFLDDGYASVEWTFDDRNERIKESFFDAKGQPVLLKKGYTTIRWEYDERGYMIWESYFDAQDQPTICENNGYHAMNREFDERGKMIRESFFDAQRRPILIPSGYATIKNEYDERGNLTKVSYFDAEGQPALQGKNYVAIEWEYDERGNNIKVSNLDAQGHLVFSAFEGFAAMEWEYDERGNLIRRTYLDAEGQPVNSPRYATVTWEYDEDGSQTKESHFDAEGQPVF